MNNYVIDQFVNTLQYGDAISGEVLSMQRVLHELGIQSDIVALHTHEKYLGLTISPEEFLNKRKERTNTNTKSAVINHFSISSSLNELFRDLKQTKKVMLYHNMTPSKWYQGYNSRVYSDLEKGAEEISTLKDIVDLAIADSTFNASELLELGFKNVEVLPLPLDPKRWEIPSNEGIKQVLKNTEVPTVNILHVGRFAANKKIEDILQIFYFYHHKLNKNSKLWLVGNDTDTEIYSFELRRITKKLALEHAVNFCGTISDSELKSFYESADAYLCTSAHEGFCVPAIEAFHFEVPVVSFGGTALTETLGEGAVTVPNRDHILAAFAVDQLLTNQTLKSSLITKAKKELTRFDINKFSSSLNSLLIEKVLSE